MHDKRHDARRQHIVLHVGIPGRPHLFEEVEVDMGPADLIELAPVCVDMADES